MQSKLSGRMSGEATKVEGEEYSKSQIPEILEVRIELRMNFQVWIMTVFSRSGRKQFTSAQKKALSSWRKGKTRYTTPFVARIVTARPVFLLPVVWRCCGKPSYSYHHHLQYHDMLARIGHDRSTALDKNSGGRPQELQRQRKQRESSRW